MQLGTVLVERRLPAAKDQRYPFLGVNKAGGGHERSDQPDDGYILRVPDMPVYQVGDEVVLLLRTPSRRGFTSPVGFADGVYRVEHTSGSARVREPNAATDKALDALLDEIDSLVKAKR